MRSRKSGTNHSARQTGSGGVMCKPKKNWLLLAPILAVPVLFVLALVWQAITGEEGSGDGLNFHIEISDENDEPNADSSADADADARDDAKSHSGKPTVISLDLSAFDLLDGLDGQEALSALGELDLGAGLDDLSGLERLEGLAAISKLAELDVLDDLGASELHALRVLPFFAVLHERSEWAERNDIWPQRKSAISDLGNVPLILETRYNTEAQGFIANNHLDEAGTLARLQSDGDTQLPDLPQGSATMLLAWWPVGAEGFTALPVWNAADEMRSAGSNGYLHWSEALAISAAPNASEAADVSFAGKFWDDAPVVTLDQFVSMSVDDNVLHRLMSAPAHRKLATMVLGRDLAIGDQLVLVGAHLMHVQQDQTVWSTMWWQGNEEADLNVDIEDESGLNLAALFGFYTTDQTADAEVPAEPDGTPNICFNPWLDAGLMHAGQGNGLQSNCVSCHQRAAYPAIDFARVTRGNAADQIPATAVKTSMLWSVAIEAE